MRKEAEGHSIEVRGSIWVIKQLVDKEIVHKSRGISLLKELKITNNRLPVKEIDKLIRQWKT